MRGEKALPEVPPSRGRLERGFTLVEIMIMLAVVAIIAVLAVANLQQTMTKSRANRALRTVGTAIDRARGEALSRHTPVGVAVSGNVVVFEDSGASNGSFDSSDPLIERLDWDERLVFGEPPSEESSPLDRLTTVVYASDGSLQSPSAGGAIYIEDGSGNRFRVKINPMTGGARIEMWTNIPPDTDRKWTARRENWQWQW